MFETFFRENEVLADNLDKCILSQTQFEDLDKIHLEELNNDQSDDDDQIEVKKKKKIKIKPVKKRKTDEQLSSTTDNLQRSESPKKKE